MLICDYLVLGPMKEPSARSPLSDSATCLSARPQMSPSLKETRADLHERFASWLESVAGERLPELEEIIGHHLEQAVGHRRSLGPTNEHADAIARRAAGFLAKAGRRAADRGDSPGSSGLLRRAVDALPEDDDERPKLLCDLAWRLLDVSLLEADEAFTQAIEAARKTADRAIETRAALGQVHTRWTSDPQRTGTEEVRRQAEAAIEVLDATGDDLGLAYAWSILSNTEYMPMRYGRCAAALEHAIIHGERAGEQAALGSILGNLCLAQLYGPTPVHEGIASCESILVHPRGNRRTEETALISLAGFHAQLGRFDRARQMLKDAQTIVQDLGLEPSADSAGHEVGCFIESLAGDYEAAERATARGYEFMEAAGALGNLSTIAANRARANIALGRVKEAERFVEIAVRTGAVDDVATQSRRLLVQALRQLGGESSVRRSGSLGSRLKSLRSVTCSTTKAPLSWTSVRSSGWQGGYQRPPKLPDKHSIDSNVRGT